MCQLLSYVACPHKPFNKNAYWDVVLLIRPFFPSIASERKLRYEEFLWKEKGKAGEIIKRKFISSVSCVRRIAELNIYSPFACIHPFDLVLPWQSMRHLFYDDSFMTQRNIVIHFCVRSKFSGWRKLFPFYLHMDFAVEIKWREIFSHCNKLHFCTERKKNGLLVFELIYLCFL